MQINKNNIRFICISHNLIVSLTMSKILRHGNEISNNQTDDKVCDLLYIFMLL